MTAHSDMSVEFDVSVARAADAADALLCTSAIFVALSFVLVDSLVVLDARATRACMPAMDLQVAFTDEVPFLAALFSLWLWLVTPAWAATTELRRRETRMLMNCILTARRLYRKS